MEQGLKLNEFNKKFLLGEVNDEDVQSRGGIVNIQCDKCNSDMRQTNSYLANGQSYLRLLVCIFCGYEENRRTNFKSFEASVYDVEGDDTK